MKINATPLAKQKFEEMLNGSKSKVVDFINNIGKYIKDKDYKLLFKGKDKDYYYKKCKKIYAIFIIEDEETIGLIDFITEVEFDKFKKD